MRHIILALSLMLSACPLFAGRSYVAKSGTGSGVFTGARTSIYSAVQYAQIGDTVFVGQGTWLPTSGTDRSYSHTFRDGVTVMGGFAGTEDSITADVIANRDFNTNATILSGEIGTSSSLDNSYHVVYVLYTTANGGAVLDGLTITRGYANGSTTSGYGPGVFVRGSDGAATDITLKNILFTDHGAGAAVCLWPTSSGRSCAVTLENCRFTNTSGGLNLYAGGGYIYATVTNCSFAAQVKLEAGLTTSYPGHIYADFYNCTLGNILYPIFKSGTMDACFYNSILAKEKSGGLTSYPAFKNCLVVGSGGSDAWALTAVDSGGNIDADPAMAVSDEGLYYLTSKSPCIDAADTTGMGSVLPALDITAAPRYAYDGLDLGAFEFQGPYLPYFTNTPATIDTTAMQDEQWTMTATAFDKDGGPFHFVLGTAPDSMTLDSASGVLTWTSTRADLGSHDVVVYVKADSVITDSLSFTIEADIINSAPNFISTTAIEDVPRLAFYNDNKTLTFRLLAEDADGDSLRFRFQRFKQPSGMTIDSLTGVISFTPTPSHPSSNDYTVEVYDPFWAKDVFSHTMYVRADNTPPVISMNRMTMDTVIQIGDDWTIDMYGSDGDNQQALFNWHYYCDDTLAGFTFDTTTGVATWSPTADQAGTYLVGFVFNDGGNVSDTFEVHLIVTDGSPVHHPQGTVPGRIYARVSAPVTGTDGLTVAYSLPSASGVVIRLITLDGTTVDAVKQPMQSAGNHTAHLGTAELPPGRYLCTVTAGGSITPLPVMLLGDN